MTWIRQLPYNHCVFHISKKWCRAKSVHLRSTYLSFLCWTCFHGMVTLLMWTLATPQYGLRIGVKMQILEEVKVKT